MNKYERLKQELQEKGEGKMKVFGNSMLPKIKSGALLTFKVKDKYEVDDIVFSRVKSRYIDAHQITKIDQNKGYLIANNHGYENGWTKQIFGYVINIEYSNQEKDAKI
jgi:phage repressor protein C with HTH and peptisase S24 domain